jgi:hypothetical protein
MNPFTVKAWKTTVPQGDGTPFCAVSILVYEEGLPKGPPWVMSERQAQHIFGVEAIDSLPLVPEMKDAVVVDMNLRIL